MDRRKFLSAGLGAAGTFALGSNACENSGAEEQESPVGRMKYRILGRTGLEVSEVSFGTYGWQDTPVLEHAIDSGVNLVCTCSDYQSGAAERAIGPAVSRNRDRVVLLSGIDCMRNPTASEMTGRLDESLSRLGVDSLDIYVPHQAATVENIENPAIPEAFEKMKAAGKARFLGISTHSAELEPMLGRAIELGYFDVILCKYNFMEYRTQHEIFARAADRGIGVIVFKVRAGARENEVRELQEKGLDLKHARIRWALSNPHVTSVCSHFGNFSSVEESIESVGVELGMRDLELLEEYRSRFDSSYCRNCGRCMESCPHGVDVAGIMRFDMYFRCYGFEKEAIGRYAALPERARPGACESCAAPCEGGCPHGLPTRANLLRAASDLRV